MTGLADQNPSKRPEDSVTVGRGEWEAIERRLDALAEERDNWHASAVADRQRRENAENELAQAHANIDQLLAALKRTEGGTC